MRIPYDYSGPDGTIAVTGDTRSDEMAGASRKAAATTAALAGEPGVRRDLGRAASGRGDRDLG